MEQMTKELHYKLAPIIFSRPGNIVRFPLREVIYTTQLRENLHSTYYRPPSQWQVTWNINIITRKKMKKE
jgi:hypothetical protein